MKKAFLWLCLLLGLTANAQLKPMTNYYVDCLNSSYQMNYAISLASPKGNFSLANEALSSAFFKAHPEKALNIKALLSYNTLGKKSAYSLVEQSTLSEEEKEYVKLWLSFYTKSTDDYATQLVDFTSKYPQNYHPIKLKLRAVIDYRDARMWNVIKEKKQNSIATIDSLLQLDRLNKEDRFYFSLLKIDFLSKKDYSKEETYSNEKIAADLIALWKADSSVFYLPNLKEALSKSDTPESKTIVEGIANEQAKGKIVFSSEKVYKMLINQNNGETQKLSVAQLESAVRKIVAAEKNPKEVNRIKAMISVFSLKQAPSNVDFIMKELLKPIPFSEAFKKAYAFPVQNKQTILADIDALTHAPEFKSRPEDAVYKKATDMLKNLSIEDLQVVDGILTFQLYYSRATSEFRGVLANFQDKLPQEAQSNMKAHFNFLEKNPLYYDDSKYFSDDFTFHSEAEVFQYVDELKKLRLSYPGAVGIAKLGLVSLARANKLISDSKRQEYYMAYFKLMVDFLAISQQENGKEGIEDNNYFGLIRDYKREGIDSYFDTFFKTLTKDNQQVCLAYLEEVMRANSPQKNLSLLYYNVTKFVGGKKYFEALLSALEMESYNVNESFNQYLLSKLNPEDIKAKLSQTEAVLKSKKSYNLRFMLLLYYWNNQADEASDLLLYLIKRNRDNYATDEGTGQYIRELVEKLDEAEAMTQLTKIKNALPDCETSFLLLLAFEYQTGSKSLQELIAEFNRTVFYKSSGKMSHYQNINFLKKRNFDTTTVEKLKALIIKKYQKPEDYFKD